MPRTDNYRNQQMQVGVKGYFLTVIKLFWYCLLPKHYAKRTQTISHVDFLSFTTQPHKYKDIFEGAREMWIQGRPLKHVFSSWRQENRSV